MTKSQQFKAGQRVIWHAYPHETHPNLRRDYDAVIVSKGAAPGEYVIQATGWPGLVHAQQQTLAATRSKVLRRRPR